MKPLSFKTTLKRVPEKGGWHYLMPPDKVVVTLREQAGKKGNIPVLATIGTSTWPSTIMSMGNQQWFAAVKADVRKNEQLSEGDTVTVKITPDFGRLKDSSRTVGQSKQDDDKALKNGDKCKVIKGTHAGKSGVVQDLKTSKTGAVTITVLQADGERFKTLAKNAIVAN